MVEGRWLRDDAVERLREAMRDLREAGNAHEQNAGKPTPQGECAGDVCDSEPVGEIVRHAWRLRSSWTASGRAAEADPSVVNVAKSMATL